MEKIKLTQGKFAIVDGEDFKNLNRYKWHYQKGTNSQTGYAAKNIRVDGKRTVLRMHHLILPKDDFLEIDHINGDGLDNRRINLRYATPTQNRQNAPVRKDSSTGFRGIRKHNNKFEVRIQENKNRHFVGSFKFLKDAVGAYNENVLIFHGEFARFQSI